MPGRLIDNLQNYVTLSADDRSALASLPSTRRSFTAGAEIVPENEAQTHCAVLIEGQAFRQKALADGRRQILSFHVPGDILDLNALFLTPDYSVSALTHGEVGLVPLPAMRELLETRPAIARGLWRISLVESAIYRAWLVGMGRRTALARIAHLLCEVFLRLKAVGLAQNGSCRFPVTQAHLADSLGLSAVHTNRVLQQLRAQGLITFQSGQLIVLDWNGLKAAGEFDPCYLHLPSDTA